MNPHARQCGLFLEPGELAELARAASAAAATAGPHPRALLLWELARALDGAAERPLGCLLLPAAADDAAEAARGYLLPSGRGQPVAGPGPHDAGATGEPFRRRAAAHPA